MSLLARVRALKSGEGLPESAAKAASRRAFGFQLLAAAVAIIAAAAAFGLLAENIADGQPLTVFDARVATWFHASAMSLTPLTRVMLVVTHVNGIAGILVLSLLFATWLAWKREWTWIALLALAVPGGMMINVLAKLAFHRQRPSFDDPLVMLSTYSFPSGHAVASTLFYGTLAAFLTPRVGPNIRPWLWALALCIVLLVCTSRIYLGAHYLSDVLAGFAEGVAWLACCLVALSTYRFRWRTRADAESAGASVQ